MADPHGMPVPSVVSSPGAPTVAGGVRVLVVDRLGAGIPNVDGDALGVGPDNNGPIPALPISTEPSGIPGRLDAVEDVAAVDEALPLGLAPQIAPLPGSAIPPPSYVLVPDVSDVGFPVAEQVVP
jgi:hypothetical protein